MSHASSPIPELNLDGFARFPVLRTRRLTLREIHPSDADALFAQQSNPLIFDFIAREPQTELAQTQELIDTLTQSYEKGEMLCWAATLRTGEQIIGTCGFNRIERENRRAEIGGSLAPKYWGKRIALEAVEAIVEYGFNTMGLHSIEAKVDAGNRSAIRLVELLGFVREAQFRDRFVHQGAFRDLLVYTLFAP